jgi:hypothetical protein
LVLCHDQSVTFVASPGYAAYEWREYNWKVIGQHTETLLPESNSSYSVFAVDSCGCESRSQSIRYLKFNEKSMRPEIYQSGNTLHSPFSDSYQWYYGNDPIPGANKSWFKPDKPGTYYVEIGYGGKLGYSDLCRIKSPGFHYQTNNVDSPLPSAPDISIYPAPSPGPITLSAKLRTYETTKVRIVNALGVTVSDQAHSGDQLSSGISVNLSHCTAGVYLVMFLNKTGVSTRQFMILR